MPLGQALGVDKMAEYVHDVKIVRILLVGDRKFISSATRVLRVAKFIKRRESGLFSKLFMH